MAYARKDYLGTRCVTTLNGAINDSTTSVTITSATGWPSVANTGFYVVIDPDTTSEEKVFVTARTGTGLTVTRGVDGTTAVSHSSGATIRPCISAVDFDEANYMVAETVGNAVAAGDLLIGAGTNNLTRLAKGSNSTVLAVDSGGTLGYTTAATAMIADNAATNAKLAGMTRGTIKVGNSSGAASDLALGTSGYYLKSDGTDAVWASMTSAEWTSAGKSLSETVTSSITLQDDDTLQFTAANGTAYAVEVEIIYDCSGAGTGGIRVAFGEDITTRGAFTVAGNISGFPTGSPAESNQTSVVVSESATTKKVLHIKGWHVGAGGTFKIKWAQGNPTDTTTVYAGSTLRYRTIV